MTKAVVCQTASSDICWLNVHSP